MTIEEQITALLTEAEPLRLLPDPEAEAAGLPALVEKINWLRKCQSLGHDEVVVAGGLYESISVPPHAGIPTTGKRGPGRPRKAE